MQSLDGASAGDLLGSTVAVDGRFMFAGTPGANSLSIYVYDAGLWGVSQTAITASGDYGSALNFFLFFTVYNPALHYTRDLPPLDVH